MHAVVTGKPCRLLPSSHKYCRLENDPYAAGSVPALPMDTNTYY